MAERIEVARKALENCRLCPRNCGVDRRAGQQGYCRLNHSLCCFREMVVDYEETGLNPSHQIYLAGCNLRCEFCTVAEWNANTDLASIISMNELIGIVEQKHISGARNINLLGGEPSVSLAGVLELLEKIDPAIPVVWNSNMYYNEIVTELLDGLIDIFLADFKYGNNDCARLLSGTDDYLEVVKRNIQRSHGKDKMIIRHLIMPGHYTCCAEPVLTWIAENVPDAKVSLRRDYIPPAEPGFAPSDYQNPREIRKAEDLARSLDLRLIQ
ncbi:MAG: radical SAM protein [Sedimentisphaerales bacterium]|nr:radical SAM protein [Sedimentisphaerales bacterium]